MVAGMDNEAPLHPAPAADPLDELIARETTGLQPRSPVKQGRPRSDRAHRDITRAFRELLIEEGFDKVRMEHVAARAKVGKATIYRHWPSKQALAQEVLVELASPHIVVPDVGDTRTELLATVLAPMRTRMKRTMTSCVDT